MLQWITDRENRFYILFYVNKYSQIMYLLSILAGSGFAVVSVFNSSLFRLPILSMGLKKHQMLEFKNKRLFSVICLQLLYASLRDELDTVTVVAVIFSLISIILTIFEYFTKKSSLKQLEHKFNFF